MPTILTIGSRGSQLALWQARHIAGRLHALGVETRLEIIRTTGDKITDVPLAQVGSKGLFTKEIEEALLDRRIDSGRAQPEGSAHRPARRPGAGRHPRTRVGLRRPGGLQVGRSQARRARRHQLLRRAAQLRRLRPDLAIENIRGNLDTRLRKLDEGLYDAIVLAAAGLRRLGWADRIAELLMPEQLCPAVGSRRFGHRNSF